MAQDQQETSQDTWGMAMEYKSRPDELSVTPAAINAKSGKDLLTDSWVFTTDPNEQKTLGKDVLRKGAIEGRTFTKAQLDLSDDDVLKQHLMTVFQIDDKKAWHIIQSYEQTLGSFFGTLAKLALRDPEDWSPLTSIDRKTDLYQQDGRIYLDCEVKRYTTIYQPDPENNPDLVERVELPGSAKFTFLYTPEGFQLQDIITSNKLLNALVEEEDVELGDAFMTYSRAEEVMQSALRHGGYDAKKWGEERFTEAGAAYNKAIDPSPLIESLEESAKWMSCPDFSKKMQAYATAEANMRIALSRYPADHAVREWGQRMLEVGRQAHDASAVELPALTALLTKSSQFVLDPDNHALEEEVKALADALPMGTALAKILAGVTIALVSTVVLSLSVGAIVITAGGFIPVLVPLMPAIFLEAGAVAVAMTGAPLAALLGTSASAATASMATLIGSSFWTKNSREVLIILQEEAKTLKDVGLDAAAPLTPPITPR